MSIKDSIKSVFKSGNEKTGYSTHVAAMLILIDIGKKYPDVKVNENHINWLIYITHIFCLSKLGKPFVNDVLIATEDGPKFNGVDVFFSNIINHAKTGQDRIKTFLDKHGVECERLNDDDEVVSVIKSATNIYLMELVDGDFHENFVSKDGLIKNALNREDKVITNEEIISVSKKYFSLKPDTDDNDINTAKKVLKI